MADGNTSLKDVTVPFFLTDDRSTTGIINMIQQTYGKTITAGQINTTAMDLLNAKSANGQYLIPSVSAATLAAGYASAQALGYDATIQGPNTISSVDQAIGDIDYVLSDKDRLSGKYYFQRDPTSDPFGAAGSLLGFPQQLSVGSQVISVANTVILSPNLTWEQHFGFTRMKAYSSTQQAFTESSMGIRLPGSQTFPQIEISLADPNISDSLEFGPSTS